MLINIFKKGVLKMPNFKFKIYENKEDYLKMKENFKSLLCERKSLTHYHYILYNLLRNKNPNIDITKFNGDTYYKLKNKVEFIIKYKMLFNLNYHFLKIFNISDIDFIEINNYIYETYFKGKKPHENI